MARPYLIFEPSAVDVEHVNHSLASWTLPTYESDLRVSVTHSESDSFVRSILQSVVCFNLHIKVMLRSKHTQHFVKGLFEKIGTSQAMGMFKLCVIKSFFAWFVFNQRQGKTCRVEINHFTTLF